MIIERKEFHCGVCNGVKELKENEAGPEICPFCGIDKSGKETGDKTYAVWPSQKTDDKNDTLPK